MRQENKRRRKSGYLVRSANWDIVFDPPSWGVLTAEDHISVLGRSLGRLSKYTYLHALTPGIQLPFLISTVHKQYPVTAVLCPDEQFVWAEPRGFPQVIRDTMQTCISSK